MKKTEKNIAETQVHLMEIGSSEPVLSVTTNTVQVTVSDDDVNEAVANLMRLARKYRKVPPLSLGPNVTVELARRGYIIVRDDRLFVTEQGFAAGGIKDRYIIDRQTPLGA